MVKGYQTLVDELTTVSYRDGMDAALKLNEIARKDEGAMDRARILADMGRIIEVVRTFIPSERWPDVQAAPDGADRGDDLVVDILSDEQRACNAATCLTCRR